MFKNLRRPQKFWESLTTEMLSLSLVGTVVQHLYVLRFYVQWLIQRHLGKHSLSRYIYLYTRSPIMMHIIQNQNYKEVITTCHWFSLFRSWYAALTLVIIGWRHPTEFHQICLLIEYIAYTTYKHTSVIRNQKKMEIFDQFPYFSDFVT